MGHYDCIGFHLLQAATRGVGRCPLGCFGGGLWSEVPRRAKLQDTVVCVLPVRSLPCTVIYFCLREVLIKQRCKGLSLPFLDTEDLQSSQATAYIIQRYICKKQCVDWELVLETFVTVILKPSSSKISERMDVFGSAGSVNTHSLMFPSDLEIIPFLL